MKFQDLIDQIKTESRIKDDDSFLPMVIGLLNELFKEAIEDQRPFEQRVDTVLPLTVTGVGQLTCPDDFFIHHQLFFHDSDTGREYQLVDQDGAIPPAPKGMYGHPKSFELLAGEPTIISLQPQIGIVAGDSIRLIYYKGVPEITPDNLTQDNPIPRLEPFLIRATIRRIRMFHSDDVQVAQMLTGDISSAAQSYSKDEPELKRSPGLNTSGS